MDHTPTEISARASPDFKVTCIRWRAILVDLGCRTIRYYTTGVSGPGISRHRSLREDTGAVGTSQAVDYLSQTRTLFRAHSSILCGVFQSPLRSFYMISFDNHRFLIMLSFLCLVCIWIASSSFVISAEEPLRFIII